MLSCQRNRCCQRILHFRLISGNFVTSSSINFVEGRRHRQLHTSHLNLQSETSTLIFADQIERRKQRPYIDSNRIEEKRAKFEYNLRKSHLDDLPVAEMHSDQEIGRIFHLNDVQTKALMVHGRETFRAMMKGETVVNSQGQVIRPPGTIYRRKVKPSDEWTIRGQIRQIFGYFRFKEAANEEEDGYGREEEEQNTPEQANKVVRIALITNLADFLIKVSAAYLTSSKSLLAEAVHSFLDLCNQGILYRGNLISVRKPDTDFPYGYGNMQYIYSMFAGFGILGAGCGLSIYNGVHGLYSNWWLGNPAELESLSLGMGLLSISFFLQFISFAKANREINKRSQKQGLSLKQYLQSSIADPSLRVVYLEDRASLCGVGFALTAIISTHFSGMPIFDSIGSICIGILLGHAAYKIIQTNAHHLVGRSLPKEKKKEIIDYMARDPIVRNMYDVKILYMGANDYRFKAEIEYNGRELTRIYLQDNCKREDLEREFANIKGYEQLEEFLMSHGDKLIDKMGDEVDRLENNTRREFPEIRHMDLESH